MTVGTCPYCSFHGIFTTHSEKKRIHAYCSEAAQPSATPLSGSPPQSGNGPVLVGWAYTCPHCSRVVAGCPHCDHVNQWSFHERQCTTCHKRFTSQIEQ